MIDSLGGLFIFFPICYCLRKFGSLLSKCHMIVLEINENEIQVITYIMGKPF
jgi:hypothetical protein